jgi:hypothetical protein
VPLQQPLAQLEALHAGGAWQAPLTHVLPETVQSWHALPPVPHSVLPVPGTHVAPLQQPPAQFDALHVGGG